MTSKYAEYRSEYSRLFMTTKFLKYVGVTICERCGLKGYSKLRRQVNTKTGASGKPYLIVEHQHWENGKTVHDKSCYIGVVHV